MALDTCRPRLAGLSVLGFPLVAMLCSFFSPASMPAAQAQIARVAAVQMVAERKAGADAAWLKAGAGTGLQVNDRLRTGRRSKVDIKFTDGSLLRLGQLSSVQIQGAKNVTLTGGRLLFSQLSPGRVVAGTATAEIIGSSGTIIMNEDGSVDFTLYTGAMDVATANKRISLPIGKTVTARTDGTLSAIRAATPFFFMDNTPDADLVEAPTNSPSVGSGTLARERQDPARSGTTQPTTQVLTQTQPTDRPLIPFVDFNPIGRPNPFPTPFPTVPPGLSTQKVAGQQPAGQQIASRSVPIRSQVTGTTGSPMTDAASNLDVSAALNHLNDVNPQMGIGGTGDVRLIGVYGNGGNYGYGGRLYAAGSQGRWFIETEFTPLKIRTKDGTTRDLTSISGANITYRLNRTIIKAGRQKFLSGPTQAALLGSMVRQAGRETMDAVSVNYLMGKGRLQMAYIYDAFPNNLPFRVSGPQKGWLGRYSIQKPFGNFGINALHYQKAPVSSGTGITADFALPVVRNQLEVYGEVGRDPFRRRLTTVGMTLPGLYNRTGFDVYLEYARVRGSNVAADLPPEIALLVYRRLNQSMNVLVALDRFSGAGTRLSLGLSSGTRLQSGHSQ